MKISIIGAGNMGGAIARGFISKKICGAQDIVCTAKHEESLKKLAGTIPGVRVSCDNAKACEGADYVILAVKPWKVEEVIKEIRDFVSAGTAVISVAAGITFEQINAFFGRTTIAFRVIPNTAVMHAESMTFIASSNANPDLINEVVKMFETLGKVLVVEESQMAAGTALASCGIAFAMQYAKASVEGGAVLGFDSKTAEEIVLQTMKGAVAVLENSTEGIQAEIRRVTTPGGITERGLRAMDSAQFVPAVVAGLKACM